MSGTKVPLTRASTGELKKFTSSERIIRQTPTENVWFCCKKGRTDARLVHYLTTVVFSFIILMFSITQLLRLPTGPEQNTYISLITLVFGIFIPTPKVKPTTSK